MTVQKYLKNSKGFTLVELLIVIAILAIIALIVIAAINPIEQANRARDTGMKADGSQMVSAIDRYFTARFLFPWNAQEPGAYAAGNDSTFGFNSAGDWHIGICANDGSDGDNCGAAGSVGDGILITTNELKPEFRNRNFIDAHITGVSAITDQLMIGKGTGASASVYTCFVPMSNANRDRACAEGSVYTLELTDTGVRVAVPQDDPTCAADSTAWTVAPGPYYVCVPE
jgi:prepilin-type N-terminal cleavage/methylation domain-containing protein